MDVNDETGDTLIAVKSSTFKPENVTDSLEWASLTEFQTFYTTTWQVQQPMDETSWMKASCTCPLHQKEYYCKHTVGIAIRMAQKRKRGRQPKSQKALIRD